MGNRCFSLNYSLTLSFRYPTNKNTRKVLRKIIEVKNHYFMAICSLEPSISPACSKHRHISRENFTGYLQHIFYIIYNPFQYNASCLLTNFKLHRKLFQYKKRRHFMPSIDCLLCIPADDWLWIPQCFFFPLPYIMPCPPFLQNHLHSWGC